MCDVEKLIEEVRKFPVLYDQTNEKYRNAEYKDRVWNNISTTLEVKGGIEECKKKWSSVRDQLRRTLLKRKMASGQAAVNNRKYKHEDILEFLLPHIVERDTLSNVPNFEDQQNDELETTIINSPEEISEQTYQLQNNRDRNEKSGTEFNNHLTSPMENILKSTNSANSSSFFIKKDKYSTPALKRKISRDGKSIDSPASQLMAYILAEKEEENKKLKNEVGDTVKHPVDAFLNGIAPTLKSLNPILLNQARSFIFSIVQEFEMKQLMNSNEQNVRVPNHVLHEPYLPAQSSEFDSTTTTPYPSPHSVPATSMNEPVDNFENRVFENLVRLE